MDDFETDDETFTQIFAGSVTAASMSEDGNGITLFYPNGRQVTLVAEGDILAIEESQYPVC